MLLFLLHSENMNRLLCLGFAFLFFDKYTYAGKYFHN